MYAFMLGSLFVTTYMITYKCLKKYRYNNNNNNNKTNYLLETLNISKIHQSEPFEHYSSRCNLLQFFTKDTNFTRLQKILDLDNGIHDKMIKLLDQDQLIYIQYCDAQRIYGKRYFNHSYEVPTVFEIRGDFFKTSIAQLNYFRWLITNDLFLYIE